MGKIPKTIGYAVFNTDLDEICLTGVWDEKEKDLKDVGKAIFDTKAEAIEYRKDFPPDDFLKVIKVLITPLRKEGKR
jgi:hypothetical protein